MSAAPAASVAQEPAFDASVYDLPIPTIDGLKADKLRLNLTGTVELDRTNIDDLEWLDTLKLGRQTTLTVEAVVTGKPQSYQPSEDGPGTTTTGVTLKVHTIRR